LSGGEFCAVQIAVEKEQIFSTGYFGNERIVSGDHFQWLGW
jgi:hypothetical protein